MIAAGSNFGGALLVLMVAMPVAGILAILGLRVHRPQRIALLVLPLNLACAVTILVLVARSNSAVSYELGGFAPPLGLMLRADGLSAAMMIMTNLILCLVGLSAWPAFRGSQTVEESRTPSVFWTLFLALSAALNLVFMAQDLFNLFVALELLTFAAVPLVCLDGSPKKVSAALRYLMFALIGSALYLLGVALLYGGYATLDIAALHGQLRDDATTSIAVGLMIAGLMAKTAVFPLHIWLPPAHSGAPAPASAILSALVIKAPFFIILRLWFDLLPGNNIVAGQLLAAIGCVSILFCSVMALKQSRLKLMIAYSTVAQVGYLFLMFAVVGADSPWTSPGWSGGILQLMSHAFAKASMFIAAGLIAEALGHDRIDDLAGAGKAAPLSVLAFAIAGLSLMGLPPSGGFVAKVMLLSGAVQVGEWWIAVTILAGGVLAASYVFRVLNKATAAAGEKTFQRLPRCRESIPLILALLAVAIGLLPMQPLDFFGIGRTVAGVGP